MSEVAHRYRRLSAAFAEKVAAVPADRWDDPTPCEGWTVRDLVRHVVDTQAMFRGLVGRESPALPSVDDDPHAAFVAASAAVQADLDDPASAAAEYDGYFGRTTFAEGIDRFASFDLVVHGWDLARATGQDERIDPAEIAIVRAHAEAAGDALRGPQAFADPIEAPPGADEQARLLAYLGRRV